MKEIRSGIAGGVEDRPIPVLAKRDTSRGSGSIVEMRKK
jgi:hypothetical protein